MFSAASQLCDLEKVICFPEPHLLICQVGPVELQGWQEKANGTMGLRRWPLPQRLLN